MENAIQICFEIENTCLPSFFTYRRPSSQHDGSTYCNGSTGRDFGKPSKICNKLPLGMFLGPHWGNHLNPAHAGEWRHSLLSPCTTSLKTPIGKSIHVNDIDDMSLFYSGSSTAMTKYKLQIAVNKITEKAENVVILLSSEDNLRSFLSQTSEIVKCSYAYIQPRSFQNGLWMRSLLFNQEV